jgi:ABC-2 type transport system ATP-binding protein
MSALVVENLRKVYASGRTALDGVSLEVPEGSFYALLGPNGAGKSTLINILADIVRPTDGHATFFGHDMFADRAWCKRRLGVVPQELAFDPFFKTRELLRITSGLFGMKPDERWIDELLERLDLAEHADKMTRQLSGGMRRRLLVAQALVHKPRLVILDEPTAGVDVELRRRLWEFMQELNARGTTILLTTHYLEEAEELCEYVAIINRGKVLTAQPMKSLLGEVAANYLWVRYDRPVSLTAADEQALAAFHPRIQEEGLCLTLTREGERLGFHEAYEAALARFGAPQDVAMRNEDLEDVFLRLTQEGRLA